jgi:hypothetical protein
LENEDLILARLIILLDLLRDELYEELLLRKGHQAHCILRTIQNKHGKEEITWSYFQQSKS